MNMIYFLLFLVILFMTLVKEFSFLFLLMIILYYLLKSPLLYGKFTCYYGIFYLDFLSFSLVLLVFLIGVLMMMKKSSNLKKDILYSQVIFSLIFILFFSFSTTSMIIFYTFFEVSLIPIFMMILGWGNQPERLNAGVSLLLYTIFASFPLLISLLYLSNTYFLLSFINLNLIFTFYSNNYLFFYFFLIFGFLVKLPMFLVHLWLPKAHVEAPVEGSMVLAAILLKLGGYGMYRMSFMFKKIDNLLLFSVCGGSLVSMICAQQMDMKIMIAYSSVAHMSMVISCFLMKTSMGVASGVLMMLSHGVCSSGMFSGANIMYQRSASRNMLMNQGTLSVLPIFSLWWFILCLGNMGGPPTVNLISEILCLLTLMNFSWIIMASIGTMMFLAVFYSIILYTQSQQGGVNLSFKSFSMTIREFNLMVIQGSYIFMMSIIFFILI